MMTSAYISLPEDLNEANTLVNENMISNVLHARTIRFSHSW